MSFGERLRALRTEKHMTQSDLGKLMDVSKASVSLYEKNQRTPDQETLKKVAQFFDVSIDYLLGVSDKRHYYALTKKDKRDIETELEDVLAGVTNKSGINFFKNGAELSDEDRALLEASLRQTITLSKELAKKKFTPNKFRGSEQ
ncbi:helix-turn-helix domain-containing protein [Schleiferilactobacillus perolens]|nr:helix-turn-helix transcriptional regulator [Schleiferilactobacillus perolens]